MTKNQQTLIGSAWLLIVFGVFGAWLAMFAKPSEAEISARQQPPTPLPTIAVNQLNQQITGLEVKGSLPINLGDAGLGREDPFAGQ